MEIYKILMDHIVGHDLNYNIIGEYEGVTWGMIPYFLDNINNSKAMMIVRDPRDVLVSKKIKKLSELDKNITIGSSSRRRELQLKKINKNVSVTNLRGNIDTRLNIEVELYNITGELILKEKNTKRIDMNNFPSGIYHVIIIYQEKRFINKIIKQ